MPAIQRILPAFLLFVVLIMATSLVAADRSSSKNSDRGVIANMVIIKFKNNSDDILRQLKAGSNSAEYLSQTHGFTALRQVFPVTPVAKNQISAVKLDRIFYGYYEGSDSPQAKARQLMADPLVDYAEPKYLHFINDQPNDSLYYRQELTYQAVLASEAWDIVKGGSGSTIVAIVDGGTDIRHRDLQNNIWINSGEIPGNQIDDDGNGFADDVYGWNFADNSGDPTGFPGTPFNRDHGTHTAGIASAVTNNTTGVAGMAWNARLMAINTSDAVEDRTIIYGYEGIKYAADNGAAAINCSWGRIGSISQFEAQILDYASSLGAVVIAAAGNNASTLPHYPSSYRNVLAIAGTDAFDNIYAASNFGYFVDMAAPAVNVYSTKHGNTYGYSTGTSMASPMAAGVVALVKTQHPEWSGLQTAQQVRVTADPLPAYGQQLGSGRLNAYRALTETWPSIRISGYNIIDDNGNNIIEPGEQVELEVRLINYLLPAGQINLNLSSADPYISIQQPQAQVAGLLTLEEKQISPSFIFTVSEDAPGAHYATIELSIESGGYLDLDRLMVSILPAYGDLQINNIGVTVTNIGRIGHPSPDQPAEGLGFSYRSGPDLLFEGALICGTGSNRLSNAARNPSGVYDQDFVGEADGDIIIRTPGQLSGQESTGTFNDQKAGTPLPVKITQATYAWNDSAGQDYVIFLYTILNYGVTDLTDFCFGIFFDWDIDGGSYDTNLIKYDPLRRLGYAYDTGAGPGTYTGIAALSVDDVSFRAIFNDENDPANPSWGIYDGFTDSEKWASISQGVSLTSAGPADVSMVIGNGPLTIAAKSVHRLAYAMLAADDSLLLMAAADSAKKRWGQLILTGLENERLSDLPASFALSQNFPNPFNPQTTITYDLPLSDQVELSIYNALGQKVVTLVNQLQKAGKYQVIWHTGGLASGVYYYRLVAGNYRAVKKMIVLK